MMLRVDFCTPGPFSCCIFSGFLFFLPLLFNTSLLLLPPHQQLFHPCLPLCFQDTFTFLQGYHKVHKCHLQPNKKKRMKKKFWVTYLCSTCTASSLACFSSCLLCLSSCSSLRRCSYSFNLARASCLLFWASRVFMNAISLTCTDKYFRMRI